MEIQIYEETGQKQAGLWMVNHMSLLRDFYGPLEGLGPGRAGLEDCESSFIHLATKKMITEKQLMRHYSRSQQASEPGKLDNVYWLPGTDNPADGLPKVRRRIWAALFGILAGPEKVARWEGQGRV